MVINEISVKVYSRMSIVDLRSQLELVCSKASNVESWGVRKMMRFLKERRKRYDELLKGIVTECYKNMSVEMDAFTDHGPCFQNYYRKATGKVKLPKGIKKGSAPKVVKPKNA